MLVKQQIAQVVNLVADVAVVIVLAMVLPWILVGAAGLAVYGDVMKKRNRWTGLDLVKEPVE